mmetsp:Transcript_10391/g.34395  ORF Transcript_10391/g.34395 Transcript_10391/m.34395 type:complete len:226 (+) Transcript_10391:908-1585(+)
MSQKTCSPPRKMVCRSGTTRFGSSRRSEQLMPPVATPSTTETRSRKSKAWSKPRQRKAIVTENTASGACCVIRWTPLYRGVSRWPSGSRPEARIKSPHWRTYSKSPGTPGSTIAPSGARKIMRSTPAVRNASTLARMRAASLWNVRRRKMSPKRPRDHPKTGMSIVVTSATKPTRTPGRTTRPRSMPTSQSTREPWLVMTTDEPFSDMVAMRSESDVCTRKPHHE